MGLIEQLKGKKVYLDTNIFIYLLEDYTSLSKPFINAIIQGDMTCYTGEITLAELLVPAFKKSSTQHVSQYTQILNDTDFVKLIPTNQEIYIKSAFFRAEFNMKLPDAIHIASADFMNCDIFLTNDKRLKVPNNIQLLPWQA